MTWRGIIFDLDGTLLDTREDIGDAMNRVLARRGYPTHPLQAYNYFVGDGAAVLVRRALPPGVRDEETVAGCLRDFLADYGVHWNVKTRPYPGIAEMLGGLSALGVEMAVLTNKPDATARKCVGLYLAGGWRFRVVQGQTDGLPKKPHPAGALRVAKELGLPPAEIVYLGDTSTDMDTAIGAGMYPVGALWGFRPESELRESGARQMAVEPADVLRMFVP